MVPKVQCRQRKGKEETEVERGDSKRTTVLPEPKQTRSEETGRKDEIDITEGTITKMENS